MIMNLAEKQSDVLDKDKHFSAQENCLRLYMVALIGYLQSYIIDLLNELCDTLPVTWSETMPLYQKKYIVLQVKNKLKDFLIDHDEDGIPIDSEIEKQRIHILNDIKPLNEPAVIAKYGARESLKGFLKDNGSKSIDKAISQFRVDKMKFSDWLDKYHPRYRGIFDLLDNAIMIRNDVAHGTYKQRITRHEARIYTVAVYRLMFKADEFLRSST